MTTMKRALLAALLAGSALTIGVVPASACDGTVCSPDASVGNCLTVTGGNVTFDPWTGRIESIRTPGVVVGRIPDDCI